MVDVNADTKAGDFRRVEVLTGPARRWRWSDETKAQIVGEAMEPGAIVSEVARRWQVSPQQVFTRRREMLRASALSFVPVVAAPADAAPASAPAPPVELHLPGRCSACPLAPMLRY